MPATVTIERIKKYFETTEQARAKATPCTENELDATRLSTMLKMCDDLCKSTKIFKNRNSPNLTKSSEMGRTGETRGGATLSKTDLG